MAVQLVWDMDGTLLDTRAVVPDAFIATVRQLGGPRYSRGEVVDAYGVGVPEQILEHLLQRRLADGEAEPYYRQLSQAVVAPYDGIAAALDELRKVGHRIVVFTGASRRAASTLLAAAALRVDLLVAGDEIEHPKPAPDGLIVVAQRLKLETADLVYIGDAPMDLLAARAAGARRVAVAWGHLYDPTIPADATLGVPGEARALLST
jgi:HAD superfamily hydrolase (TIGR01509 family)